MHELQTAYNHLNVKYYTFIYFRNALGNKIMGCPVCIDNPKYARNALIFNLCFVFDTTSQPRRYEPVVKKLASYLVALEVSDGFPNFWQR